MKREFFNKQFAALCAAYAMSHKLSDESQDVYWEMLQGIPDQVFGRAVKECLSSCKFFPTIAELGEASFPTKTELGPYNPYRESLKRVDWREQVERIAERARIDDSKKKLLSS